MPPTSHRNSSKKATKSSTPHSCSPFPRASSNSVGPKLINPIDYSFHFCEFGLIRNFFCPFLCGKNLWHRKEIFQCLHFGAQHCVRENEGGNVYVPPITVDERRVISALRFASLLFSVLRRVLLCSCFRPSPSIEQIAWPECMNLRQTVGFPTKRVLPNCRSSTKQRTAASDWRYLALR